MNTISPLIKTRPLKIYLSGLVLISGEMVVILKLRIVRFPLLFLQFLNAAEKSAVHCCHTVAYLGFQ